MKTKFKLVNLLMVCLALCSFFASCDNLDGTSGGGTDIPDPDALSKPGQKQLNVVYFLPNDVDAYANYQQRLTDVLKHVQEYYAEELSDYGFEYKKFGLQEDPESPGLVKIHLINAQETSADYPYDGGGRKAIVEIDAYFAENPDLKTSDHILVFIPRYEVGVPFYGIGKYAFVRDYENGYDMSKWVDGVGFPSVDDKWIGGLIHELGHGLNLPHNRQKISDNFTAMMGNGNSQYWSNPNGIKLTKASSLILDNNQIFNTDPSIDFYTETPNLEIKKQRIYADSENLYATIQFETDIPVKGMIMYNDPKTGPNDLNYNAITWTSTNISINNNRKEISFTMPLSDIDEEYKQYPFKLNISAVFENGERKTFSNHDYNYVDRKPDIDIDYYLYDDFDKSNWTVEASSEETGFQGSTGLAVYLLDNDPATLWHSGYYSSFPHPHSVTVDMKEIKSLSGISILQNQQNANGMMKDFTIEVSTDNVSYTEIGAHTATDDMLKQQFVFESATNARYFRITSLSSYNNRPVTRLAEVGAF
ncbi:discoidin domain-containing protein [Joostella sp. CR20]|uniref:discoidin domain-containing protein n=1 Tax=Joostella sp. CR20 TaxID=2804312 RepID=UPI00313E4212